LKSIVTQAAIDVIQSPRTAWGVFTATIGTGISTVIQAIPEDIGKAGTLLGIIGSLIVLYIQIKRHKNQEVIHQLKKAVLEKELAE